MTGSILSSMNQSETDTDAESSNANLSKQSPTGIDLSGIPHFNPITREPSTESSPMEPPLCNERDSTYEYEFTCIFTDSTPMFIGLWDNNDLSACQRVSASNIGQEEIVYNQTTGIAFFKTMDGLRWCFKKQPIDRSIGPLRPIGGDEGIETKSRRIVHTSPESADEILATL